MSRIRTNLITNRMANGAPTVSNGLVISGVTTSTNVSVASSVTATTYYGSGANLTNITQTTINNNADNRVITGSGTANTLEAESSVVINGGKLGIGVASPAQLIEVHGASNPAVLVQDTTNNCISYMYSQDSVATFGSASNHPVVFNVSNGEKARIDTSGNLLLGTSTAAIGGGRGLMIANSAGARIKLCDSDAGVTANDGFEIIAGNGGTGYINNKENQAIVISTNNTERMRVTHEGSVGIGTDNSTYELEVHDGTGAAALRMKDGANNVICDLIANSTGGLLRTTYNHPLVFHTNQTERLRITNDGKIGINDSTPSVTLETVGHNQVTFGSMPETIITYGTASAYNSGSAGSGIQFGGKYNSSGEYTIFAGVHGVKGNTSNGPYGGALILSVRQNNTSSFERMRVSEYGTITNTTASSHSQGAGTFNIKGVINQYSQGSGSGLIFDCDFGRLTGYSDNGGISNSTNLSAALAHSTTDWTSSSSNTPMTVNGGSFNYRVGFGGYLDCVQNEGRISIAAGSGSPNMAETLNTASMTIESWIWYDGAGREVIVSRYGSGFPNQFNMLCDPDGQFHYNNSGVGAGSGNMTGQNFPDKTWHHHVWQYDSGNNVNRWYINGAFANSRSAGSSLAVSSATGFSIASRADDMERWDGKIAVVRIYNRALSAAEIKNHFELDRGRFGV